MPNNNRNQSSSYSIVKYLKYGTLMGVAALTEGVKAFDGAGGDYYSYRCDHYCERYYRSPCPVTYVDKPCPPSPDNFYSGAMVGAAFVGTLGLLFAARHKIKAMVNAVAAEVTISNVLSSRYQ